MWRGAKASWKIFQRVLVIVLQPCCNGVFLLAITGLPASLKVTGAPLAGAVNEENYFQSIWFITEGLNYSSNEAELHRSWWSTSAPKKHNAVHLRGIESSTAGHRTATHGSSFWKGQRWFCDSISLFSSPVQGSLERKNILMGSQCSTKCSQTSSFMWGHTVYWVLLQCWA